MNPTCAKTDRLCPYCRRRPCPRFFGHCKAPACRAAFGQVRSRIIAQTKKDRGGLTVRVTRRGKQDPDRARRLEALIQKYSTVKI